MLSIDASPVPSLKQFVYDKLRNSIISGELTPGAKLIEQDISNDLNISRAPVREALNMLERDGLATIVPRHGAVVSSLSMDDIRDIWEMRELLEPLAAIQAVSNIPGKDIDYVERLILEVLEDPTDSTKYMESDLALHDMLYTYANNSYLRTELHTLKIHSSCARWSKDLKQRVNHDVPKTVIDISNEHMGIIKALRSRNPEQVEESVRQHIKNGSIRMLKDGEIV